DGYRDGQFAAAVAGKVTCFVGMATRFCYADQRREPYEPNAMTRRSRAREVAIQLLFQRDHNPTVARPDVERFATDRLRDPSLTAYCLNLYDGVAAHQPEVDRRLAEAAENWRLTRMATVDRN